jgi:hypothetical protein
MIIQYNNSLNNSFFNSKFANQKLGDQRTLRIGNIISFVSPVNFNIDNKNYNSDQSINFCIELPELSNYAGVCFQNLFITNVANILANKYIKDNIEVINNEIIIKKEHTNSGIHQVDGIVSLNHIVNTNGAILIYLGLYNKISVNSQPRAIALNMKQEQYNNFMDVTNESFYHLANSIFLQTAKM